MPPVSQAVFVPSCGRRLSDVVALHAVVRRISPPCVANIWSSPVAQRLEKGLMAVWSPIHNMRPRIFEGRDEFSSGTAA
eukprot:8574995-Pyramimonas_sp.AAC.2